MNVPPRDVAAIAERLLAEGQLGQAAQLLTDAVARDGADDRTGPLLAQALGAIDPPGYHPRFEADLIACYALPVDHQLLARATARLLLHKYRGDMAADLPRAADDPLLAAFLSRCINVDPAMEHGLLSLRRALIGDRTPWPALMAAMALQAEANEYAWPCSDDDLTRATRHSPLARAMVERPADPADLPPELTDRLFAEPERERVLAAAIPSLGATADSVSSAVREHYEQNPYPRWRTPPPRRPGALLRQQRQLPGLGDIEQPASILVAGCGTGYEAIDLALGNPDAAIVALDLSRASLGYAARMASEAGAANIEWRQGDILALPALGREVDLATSTGVLHHMADPTAGLAAIAVVVRPGGLVRLAVYSRRARALVASAHELIAEQGWRPDLAGIRALRAHILALPTGAPLAALRESDDLYSVSGCRDLLFHRHEALFSLPELAALVRGAGLVPLALDVDQRAARVFSETFRRQADPTDLDRWDKLEGQHPDLFAGMYHLWCRKPHQ